MSRPDHAGVSLAVGARPRDGGRRGPRDKPDRSKLEPATTIESRAPDVTSPGGRITLGSATMSEPGRSSTARFDVAAIAAALPETAQTLLVDTYLTDREAASARVFRV